MGPSRMSSEVSPSMPDCRRLSADRLWYSPVSSKMAAPADGLCCWLARSTVAARVSGDGFVSTLTDALATLGVAEREFVPTTTEPPTTGGVTDVGVLFSTLSRLEEEKKCHANTKCARRSRIRNETMTRDMKRWM